MTRRNKYVLVSTVGSLRPANVWNTSTGEELSLQFSEDVDSLLTYVRDDVQSMFASQKDDVLRDAAGLKGNANGYARTLGYASSYKFLPRTVKAASRINEIVLHKLFSETASYVRNPNPRKQLPSFGKTVNLGAVDKQMASMSIDLDTKTLTLLWKCWENEYLLEFHVPGYVFSKNIAKFCLPTVRLTSKGVMFDFPVQEIVPAVKKSTLNAGLDLGRVEPYVVAVSNSKGNRIAHYEASGRLKKLNAKREHILGHAANLQRKIAAYESLGVLPEKIETLRQERARLRNKASRLVKPVAQNTASEIARKLHKHNLSSLRIEDLSWAHGSKYGSKWAHSITQNAVEHAAKRNGTKTERVNPRGTSQHCHGCGTKLTHNSRTRTVRCADCQTVLDRDFNAAMNIAKKKSYPASTSRAAGNNPSVSHDTAGCQPEGCSSTSKKQQQLQL